MMMTASVAFTTAYNYDALNRLLTKTPDATLSQPAVHFTYTSTGQRLSMVDASGTTGRATFTTNVYVTDPLVQVVQPTTIHVTVIVQKIGEGSGH